MSQALIVKRVAVVDDIEDSRATTVDKLVDAGYAALPITGQFRSSVELVRAISDLADAAVCDHHLNERQYALCSGAEAVGALYDKQIPAILVTKYARADVDVIRRYRRKIAALMRPDEASPLAIEDGFRACLDEFQSVYSPFRKAWQTMLRVDGVDQSQRPPILYAVVPAWRSSEVVRFPLDLLPLPLRDLAVPGRQFFAWVNIGAEDSEDLFFEDFEDRGVSSNV